MTKLDQATRAAALAIVRVLWTALDYLQIVNRWGERHTTRLYRWAVRA